MRKTVMIMGISSFVGTNLALMLKDEFRVVGTYHTTPVDFPEVMCLPCDVLKKDYVQRIISTVKPDFVIYAAGMSSLTECKQNSKLADALNSAGAINCMSAAERTGARFVYISSGFVMEGQNVLYKESDTPFPSSTYGTTLASTEFYIQRSSLNYFILRCPVLYGRSLNVKHENFFELMQRKIAKGESYSVDGSTVTGFLDVTIMAELLKACLINNVQNRLLQISSSDTMTRFDFARKYAEVFKKDENFILRADIKFPDDAGKGKEKLVGYSFKMDSTNIETFLGIKMPSVEDSLRVSFKRLHSVV
jgi:dTDP-4-dehydrorhamnose reductase